MPYCSNCGQMISADTKYCTYCGTENLAKKAKREAVSEGSVHKCPYCGEAVPSFTVICPMCGHEFRNIEATSSVSSFSKQIQVIESKKKASSALSSVMDINANDEEINLIKNYAVPNSKEDIIEFMILATSNINVGMSYYQSSLAERKLSDAWLSKADQVYKKAQLAFGEDEDFDRIQDLYLEAKGADKRTKRGINKLLIVCFLILLLIPITIGAVFLGINIYESSIERQLEATVVQIQQDIASGNYDEALIKANGLRFDSSINYKKEKQWDEQRKYLIELIEQKMEEEGK